MGKRVIEEAWRGVGRGERGIDIAGVVDGATAYGAVNCHFVRECHYGDFGGRFGLDVFQFK